MDLGAGKGIPSTQFASKRKATTKKTTESDNESIAGSTSSNEGGIDGGKQED